MTDTAAAAPRSPNLLGWSVVGLSFLALALVFASRGSLGLMMPIWEKDLGWSRSFVSTGGAIALITMGVASPIFGNLLDRHGPRLVYAGGLLLVGMGVCAVALTQSPVIFIVLLGVVGGFGNGAINMSGVSATLARLFTARRGLATGIALAGGSGGQLFVLPLLAALLTAFSWRDAYLFYGVAILTLAVVAYVLLGSVPKPVHVARAGHVSTADPLSKRLGFLLRNNVFLFLFGAFFLCGLTTSGVVDVHYLAYTTWCGFPPVDSSIGYGVMGVGNMLGLFLFGYLADRVNTARLLAALFFVRALLFIAFMYVAGDLPLLFAFSAVFGLLNYATLPLVATIVAHRIGIGIMGLSMGLLLGAHSLGGALGAFLGGFLFDRFARYDVTWWLAMGLAAMAGVFALLVDAAKPRTPAPQAA